jgi:hypothetical protein
MTKDSTNEPRGCSSVYQRAEMYNAAGELCTSPDVDHDSRKVVSTSKLEGRLEVRVTTRSVKLNAQTSG